MIKEVIDIGGTPVEFAASASTPRVYRTLFTGRDFFDDYDSVINNKDMEAGENIAYTLAYQADPGILPINEWLDQFSAFGVMMAMPDLFRLLAANSKQTSTPKKEQSPQTEV